MLIRPAKPEDSEILAEIHIDAWKAAYCGLVPQDYLQKLDYGKRAERFRALLTTDSENTFVAEEEQKLLGFITLGNCRDDDVDPKETGEIWGIYLAAENWRKGIGTKLCCFGENLLLSCGFKIIVLWVFAENEQARKFYEALGFAADGAEKTLNRGKLLLAVRYRKRIV